MKYSSDREVWRDVKDYIDLYEVSNWGNVRKFFAEETHRVKQTKNKSGYMCVSLRGNDGKQSSHRVHRLVAEAFPEICGKLTKTLEVDHINTIRDDNRAENLRVVTHEENMENKITKERVNRLGLNFGTVKPVMQYRDSKLIAEYRSPKYAAEINKVDIDDICKCCCREIDKIGEYTYRYKYDDMA